MAKTQNNNESHSVAIGVSIAAVAAAAAGAYYLYGTEKGKKQRKVMKSWMLNMKADVMDEIENLKDLNEEMYKNAVAKIADKYAKLKNIDTGEVMALAMRMKSHWKDIQRDITQSSKSLTKKSNTKRTVKKASK
ncbi:MAG: hypothetical protein M3Q80_00555 [bacterium]|nr:hypothetical protein [bacterium]